jgi:hypothetical protein
MKQLKTWRKVTMNKELQFLIYNTPQENIKVDVVVKDETIWLTQKAMAALFGVQTPAISKHLKNIFHEGELDEKVVVSILEITTQHGAIISVAVRHCGLDPQSPEKMRDSDFRQNDGFRRNDGKKLKQAA